LKSGLVGHLAHSRLSFSSPDDDTEKSIMAHSPDDGNSLPTDRMDEIQSISPSSSKSSETDPGFSFEMPPKKVGYKVQNCEDLRSYLKQSDELYKAFESRFGTKEGTAETDHSGTNDEKLLESVGDNERRESASRKKY
jgi:hypothetical protein